ncbi:ATP-binding protein [Synechococcus sp. CBW1107]|uniref:ATP-binding protein n=1 Tax=Synechococcus sp. CBW1107 TaxID=2789857 RepID=UPI002AD3A7E8|nr:ATP-binding protein [Synechococcus sp. CBW1107]CAK6688523.1 Sensor histidine kinase RcsC [Synechococcus sp. CBW1107]
MSASRARFFGGISPMAATGLFAFLAYVATGLLGQNLVFQGTTISPLWLAAGVALGLGLRCGTRRGAVAVGVFFGQFLVFAEGPQLKAWLLGGQVLGSEVPLALALLPAAGSLVGLLLALAYLHRWGIGSRIDRPLDYLNLAAAAAIQAAVAALAGATALALAGAIPWEIWPDVATTWARGDWLGGILVAPLFLARPDPRLRGARFKAGSWEKAMVLLSTVVVALIIFGGVSQSAARQLSGTYFCFLPLLWGALRCSSRVVALQVVLLALAATLPTLGGLGPFAGFATLNDRMLSLQAFLGVESLTAMLLGAIEQQKLRVEVERDRQAGQLLEAKERAEAGSRAKTEFLANMSHEIRTPLNGVLGAAQLLASSPLSADQRELLEAIQASGDGLLVLLNDLLDFSRIEAGQLALQAAPFEPRRLAAQVVDLYRPSLAAGVELRLENGPELPAWLLGDASRLRQVLSNLIGNAVKFTPAPGEIRVRQQGAAGAYRLEVIDTGIGIPAEHQARLFQPFQQGDASTGRRFGGTGLGLVISRRLVELLGGTITLESAAGQGTTLRVLLPLPVAEPPAERSVAGVSTSAAPAKAVSRPVRVLMAEDNQLNQRILERMLASAATPGLAPFPAVLGKATNGREAVALWEEGAWDLILMDCQMPELDGFAATREIRRRELAGGLVPVPIIAVTANAAASDRHDCLAAGMNDVLTKPVRLEALLEMVRRWAPTPEPLP